ncbi:hypothetical protein N7462_005202 [Penicillium macrosclerotiorum]|uniref:uncharacterized protein n=1 Tax=Penicillium macrosclerotiorum TaxID=303699 RepID=UPI0025468F4F|nr:uncharacterized protein N7462_005202 [Penicillium macrosclerotiorum]KAJ5690810.1 hypothetical protein N7462_005202 [Penicillium macrosclerotiorum]
MDSYIDDITKTSARLSNYIMTHFALDWKVIASITLCFEIYGAAGQSPDGRMYQIKSKRIPLIDNLKLLQLFPIPEKISIAQRKEGGEGVGGYFGKRQRLEKQ